MSALAFYSLLCINAGEHINCWVLKPEVRNIFRLEAMFSMALLHDVLLSEINIAQQYRNKLLSD